MPPKRGKSGPPYTDIPEEVYVVVSYPWGMHRDARQRRQVDFDRIASWAQLVLRQGGLGGGRLASVECIYGMGTRDEIIIQFAPDTDVIPLLGEHRWANIAKKWTGSPDDSTATRVFLYNWRDNGDPSLHNWTENFPHPLSLDNVPAKSPYPAPSWTAPPLSLANFVLPIPRPAVPPPAPDAANVQQARPSTKSIPPVLAPPQTPPAQEDEPESGEQPESREQSESQDPAPTDLFRPYEPPAHARFLNQEPTELNEPSSSRTSPPRPKLLMKLDPYEQEEDALSLLRDPSPYEEDTSDVKPKVEYTQVKMEDGNTYGSGLLSESVPPASLGYQPKAELKDFLNAHLQNVAGTSSGRSISTQVTVKREYEEDKSAFLVPPASLGYQPGAELEDHINAHLRNATCAPSGSGTGSTQTRVTVKREHEEGRITPLVPPASLRYQPGAELEEYINAHLRDVTGAPSGSGTGTTPARVTVKREYEEDRSVPLASFGYKPGAELEGYINAHLGNGSAASGDGARLTPDTRGTGKVLCARGRRVNEMPSMAAVKREYEEDTTLFSDSKRVKIKIEDL